MTWASVLSNFDFWSNSDPAKQWSLRFGSPTLSEFSPADQSTILSHLQNFYNTSVTARQIFDDVVASDGRIRIGYVPDNLGFAYLQPGITYVGIDINAANSFRYFNTSGVLVNELPQLTLIHELVHSLVGLRDTDPNGNPNSSNYDFRGDTVRMQNQIALEMGYTSNYQASYSAGFKNTDPDWGSYFQQGVSYSENEIIDNVRIGDGSVDNLDMSARSDNSRDLIFGHAGADMIKGGGGRDFLYGNEGNDVLIDGGAGDDVIYGGDGSDVVTGGDGDDRIYGGNFRTPLGSGGEFDTDKLHGGAGNDVIWGGEGDDELFGDDGEDELRGGAGVDIIHGGKGNDAIYDGLGDDQLFGGDDDDTFYFEGGTNSFDGGAGTDTLSFAESQTGVIILLTPTGQTAYGSNTIANIERLSGSNFADSFDWQDASAPPTGDLSISGGGGDDLIAAGTGSNLLSGDDGNDTFRLLLGGPTTVNGGTGVDTVSFDAAAAGVSAVIGDGVLLGPDGFSFDSVENLIGSDFRDTIGHDGSDSLVASGGGDDILTIGTGDHPAFLMTGHGEDHVKINSIAYPRETYILDSGAGDRLFDSYHNISINWVIDNAGQTSVDTYESHTRHQFDINATAFGDISYSVVLSFYNPGYYGQFEGQSGFDRGIVEISYGFGEAHPQENGIMGNFTAVVFDFQTGDFGISLGGYEAIAVDDLQAETVEFLNILEAYNDEPYVNVMAAVSSQNTWDMMI